METNIKDSVPVVNISYRSNFEIEFQNSWNNEARIGQTRRYSWDNLDQNVNMARSYYSPQVEGSYQSINSMNVFFSITLELCFTFVLMALKICKGSKEEK